jgi:hypothetical protein
MPDKPLKKTPPAMYVGYVVLSVFCFFYIYYAVQVNHYAWEHKPDEETFVISIWDYKRTVYSTIAFAIIYQVWMRAFTPFFRTIAKV